jgi:hypothetical protein
MSVGYSFVTVLIIFAVLVSIGNPSSIALQKAMQGKLTDADVAKLPLTWHAKMFHQADYYTAEIIQELLLKGFCSPKRMYLNCAEHKVLFACKPSRASRTRTWALLVIGLAGWQPAIITGYAVDERKLDATALKNSCSIPGIALP